MTNGQIVQYLAEHANLHYWPYTRLVTITGDEYLGFIGKSMLTRLMLHAGVWPFKLENGELKYFAPYTIARLEWIHE
jgi:hypothetical protein